MQVEASPSDVLENLIYPILFAVVFAGGLVAFLVVYRFSKWRFSVLYVFEVRAPLLTLSVTLTPRNTDTVSCAGKAVFLVYLILEALNISDEDRSEDYRAWVIDLYGNGSYSLVLMVYS